MKRLFLLPFLPLLTGCSGCGDGGSETLPPRDPTGLTALAVSSGRVDLAWTDASSDELEFRLEASRDGVTFVEVAQLPMGTVAHSMLALLPGTSYTFRVRAFGYGGFSGYAGPAGATTLLPTRSGPTATALGARWDHSVIIDPPGQRMVAFGGVAGGIPVNDVWSLDLAGGGGWVDLTPGAGPAPSARADHSAVYDALNRRMIVFGGPLGALENEVWAFDLAGSAGWMLLVAGSAAPSPAAPSPRSGHAAVYDPGQQRMIVFGGNDGGAILNDVWALSLPSTGTPSWSLLSPANGPPLPRENHSAVYDPAAGRMIIYGGNDNSPANDGSVLCGDTWALEFAAGSATWRLLQPSGPAPAPLRERHAAVYDSTHRRMLVIGGMDDAANPLEDTWALGLAWDLSWVQVFPAGPPSPRLRHAAVFDPSASRVLITGGDDDTFTGFDELWEFAG